MTYDNDNGIGNKKTTERKSKFNFEKRLNDLLKELYEWLCQVNNIGWPLGAIMSLISLGLPFFAAKNYIKIEHLSVDIASVFVRIVPGLLLYVVIILIFFMMILMIPVFMLVYDKNIIRSRFIIFHSILFVFNAIELFVVYLIKYPITIGQMTVLMFFPVIVFIGFSVAYGLSKSVIMSVFSVDSIFYVAFVQVALWLFYLPLASVIMDSYWDVIVFLLALSFSLIIFIGPIGFLYDKKTIRYYALLAGVVLSVIALILLEHGDLIEKLARDILSVRSPDGRFCVVLYQENNSDKGCKEIQKNELLSNSLMPYKIGGSDRLRIPFFGDGIFHVRQDEETVEKQITKSISGISSVSDTRHVPISNIKLICGCPGQEEEGYAASAKLPASIPQNSTASAPQPITPEPKSSVSTPHPTGVIFMTEPALPSK